MSNAVQPINDLRIAETLDEFESITTGYGKSSSLKYQTDYDLLINACVRYDRTKKANIAKRGCIFQTSFIPNNDGFNNDLPSEAPNTDPHMGINTPSDELYTINTNQSGLLDINLNPDFSVQIKVQIVRRHCSNPDRHTDRLIMFVCYSDTSDR